MGPRVPLPDGLKHHSLTAVSSPWRRVQTLNALLCRDCQQTARQTGPQPAMHTIFLPGQLGSACPLAKRPSILLGTCQSYYLSTLSPSSFLSCIYPFRMYLLRTCWIPGSGLGMRIQRWNSQALPARSFQSRKPSLTTEAHCLFWTPFNITWLVQPWLSLILSPTYRWGNWAPERLRALSMVTQSVGSP